MSKWIIADRESAKPYILVEYKTEKEAVREMACLLRFFPVDHDWRRRLHVVERKHSKGMSKTSHVGVADEEGVPDEEGVEFEIVTNEWEDHQ